MHQPFEYLLPAPRRVEMVPGLPVPLTRLVPEFRVGAVGQLAIDDRDVAAALPGLGASGALLGNNDDAVRAALGAGVTWQMGDMLSFFVDLGGEVGGKYQNATASGGVRFLF